MLLGFCGENKGNKKRLKPKRGLQPNFYPAKKLLADSNNNKRKNHELYNHSLRQRGK